MRKCNQTGTILSSLIIGALAGAVVALLFAPQSGEETRAQLAEKLDSLKDELDSYANDFSEKAQKIKKDLQEKIKQTEAELNNIEHEFSV